MAVVTSIMRAQQVLLARVDEQLADFNLSFARFELLRLLAFTRHGELPLGKARRSSSGPSHEHHERGRSAGGSGARRTPPTPNRPSHHSGGDHPGGQQGGGTGHRGVERRGVHGRWRPVGAGSLAALPPAGEGSSERVKSTPRAVGAKGQRARTLDVRVIGQDRCRRELGRGDADGGGHLQQRFGVEAGNASSAFPPRSFRTFSSASPW